MIRHQASGTARSALLGFLLVVTVLQCVWTLQTTAKAGVNFRRFLGASNDDRRQWGWGPMFDAVLAARDQVPASATLWWVSPDEPFFMNYFLQPRLMRWGDPSPSQAEALQRQHPSDWILIYDRRWPLPHFRLLAPRSGDASKGGVDR